MVVITTNLNHRRLCENRIRIAGLVIRVIVSHLQPGPTESVHGSRHDELGALSHGKAARVDLHFRKILLAVRIPGPRGKDRVGHFDTWGVGGGCFNFS